MKLSIVTAYHNRKKLFYNTLKSISNSKFYDFEFIVVDDCSSEDQRLEDLLNEFSFLKIIRIEPKDKWYVNPCVPFNIGIKASQGEIIVLQNPECYHVHDIISYFSENINDSNYISISTYALNEEYTEKFLINNENILNIFSLLPQQPTGGSPIMGWYNHSKYRPVHYHFCSAITRKNLIDNLGCFDERYANGISYDDTEFIERLYRLGLNMIIADNVSVIHQWHPSVFYNMKNFQELHTKNRILFFNVSRNENKIKVNL